MQHAGTTTGCRLGAIGFINTLPIYNAELQLPDGVALTYDTPAGLNALMAVGELDISPVSAAHYLENQNRYTLLPGLSVSSFGGVESVLYLERPNAQPDNIIAVPDDSATSVAVLRHLLATWGNPNPRFETIPADRMAAMLAEGRSGLIIGDNALRLYAAKLGESSETLPEGLKNHLWVDLATEWQQLYAAPLVFAVWVVQKGFSVQHPEQVKDVMLALQQARHTFFNSPDAETLEQYAVQQAQRHLPLPVQTLQRYWHTALDYRWSDAHVAGLTRLQSALQAQSLVKSPVGASA